MSNKIEDIPNNGIWGLGPGPYCDDSLNSVVPGRIRWSEPFSWPTEGYDGTVQPKELSRMEWLELADVMIARWTEFREQVRVVDNGLLEVP